LYSVKHLGGAGVIYNGLQPTDKRENPRKNFKGPIMINHPLKTPSVIRGQIQNISVGGIRVKIGTSPALFQAGDGVGFIINKDYFILEGEGKIIWTSAVEAAVGIKFNPLPEKAKTSLEQLLGLLS
jgi:hypothetical protein